MATQELQLTGFITVLPTDRAATYERVYEQNRHRVYSLAFWMTDNEMTAEGLMGHVFRRAFAQSAQPSPEAIDRALIAELRSIAPMGVLTLEANTETEVRNVRRNILRTHLERAVVQVPRTERFIFLLHDVEGYDHGRIGKLLGMSVTDSRVGLYQARVRLRQLVGGMQN